MGRRYYADPTADIAIAHVVKEQKKAEKQMEKKVKKISFS